MAPSRPVLTSPRGWTGYKWVRGGREEVSRGHSLGPPWGTWASSHFLGLRRPSLPCPPPKTPGALKSPREKCGFHPEDQGVP